MRKFSNIIGAVFLLLAAIVPVNQAFAAGYRVIRSFCREGGDCPNGSNGFGLVRDAAGNLYGVAQGGIPYAGVGIVFELSPNAATGKWDYRVIHTFCQKLKQSCKDSESPSVSLTIDRSGNLYGATFGANGGGGDYGVVYELSPTAGQSQWSYTILARFGDKRGWEPFGDLSYAGKSAGLPYDGVSPLYGETSISEKSLGGSIYELRPTDGTPAWKFNTVHQFCSTDCLDGQFPGPVTVDATGNLYGATEIGGQYAAGLVFRLSPRPNGGWKETVLHAFCSAANCTDGQTPLGSVFLDAAGDIFGFTNAGGGVCVKTAEGCGLLYELLPNGREKILHAFCQTDCADGASPWSLINDGAGNLFGTTNTTAFVFRKNNTLKTLLTFCTTNCGGPLMVYSPTELVGATYNGGLYGQGAIFEITHNTLP